MIIGDLYFRGIAVIPFKDYILISLKVAFPDADINSIR